MANVSASEPSTSGVEPAWPGYSHHHGTSGSPHTSRHAAISRSSRWGVARSFHGGMRMTRL